MYRKYTIGKVEYPYQSKIIKRNICVENNIEEDICELNKKIFDKMLRLYIQKESLNQRHTQLAVVSGADANAKTAKLWSQYQKLDEAFKKKYGDFYNDFVKFSSGPGPCTAHVTFDSSIVTNSMDARLLNKFEIAIREYRCGQKFKRKVYGNDDARQKYDMLGKLAIKYADKHNSSKNEDTKWLWVYKQIKKHNPKFIRNVSETSEAGRIRLAAFKYKKLHNLK